MACKFASFKLLFNIHFCFKFGKLVLLLITGNFKGMNDLEFIKCLLTLPVDFLCILLNFNAEL